MHCRKNPLEDLKPFDAIEKLEALNHLSLKFSGIVLEDLYDIITKSLLEKRLFTLVLDFQLNFYVI
jgi:hypothetical protein